MHSIQTKMTSCVKCQCFAGAEDGPRILPAPAVAPPAGASPLSSSSVCGFPAVCVCGRYALSETLLHKSQSVDKTHQRGNEPATEPDFCRNKPVQRIATWGRSLQTKENLQLNGH